MDEQLATAQSTASEHDSEQPAPPYLIRREPVLDKALSLLAYALQPVWLDGGRHDPAFAIVEQCRSNGPERFMGHLPHIIQATPELLLNTYAHSLPQARVLLEIPEGTEPTPELLQGIGALTRSGLRFMLRADLAGDQAYEPLVPFCKAICFDLRFTAKAALFRDSFQHKQAKRALYAAHIPDRDTLDTCKTLGFTHFLGPLPEAADVPRPASLSKKQTVLLELITLILGDGDGQAIKACLEQDPALVRTLLNMVNTPAFGLSQEVESLNQAILLLGRRQLQRWVQVLMYTESERPKGFLSPALITATARGRLLESLAQSEYPEQAIRSETAFSVGALSVMDQLFGGTMQDVLAHLTVDVPVRAALLDHDGPFGEDLRLAECLFPISSAQNHDAAPLLRGRHPSDINAMTHKAFDWSHTVTQSAR